MGDRVKAAELLRPAREQQGRNLLADVVLCLFEADESGRDDALETLLRETPNDQIDAEPTCLLFLADRAIRRGDLDAALGLYERAYARYPRIVGGRLGKARVLIERMVVGRSALPSRDQRKAVALAVAVRDDMRRWAGPSENAHRLVVHERMLVGAFSEVILLATPSEFGGQASDREAVDPIVAILAAKASVALGDRIRAGRFGDAVRGTPAESLIRALAADPGRPLPETIALWRAAFARADTPLSARMCLTQLATLGALTPTDLDQAAPLANLDGDDRALFTARNAAATGDLDMAVAMLRSMGSPSAGEMLIEVLRDAGHYDEALAACDQLWANYGALKALQDKINILASVGDYEAAEACAAQLLAGNDLPSEQRRRLHDRLIGRSMELGDWSMAESRCRAALDDQTDEPSYAWGLILCQLNQGRWGAAWASYQQLAPDIDDPDVIPAWVDLHLRFGVTPDTLTLAEELGRQFAENPSVRSHLARLQRGSSVHRQPPLSEYGSGS